MTTDERIKKLEDEILQLKQSDKKDRWDKFGVVSAALIPLAIAGVGGAYSYYSQRATTQVARIQTVAESKIKQAELVSKFFDSLTGGDERKRQFAVDSLLVAAPDYGPVLVRVVAKTAETPKSAAYANTALDNRRDSLIRQMFGDDPDQRKTAYDQLLASWSNDESLVVAIIKYGMGNKSNSNGIYNALTLLSHMQRDTIKGRKSQIIEFADAVEANGSKTKERTDALRRMLGS